ncbi:hypothetical protein [Brevundimonas sp. R86498]|uniref:hypothetical protein n=1 Tax=Brevundimonas sp. R86498 TaxID=3093845 RepID=UPI0037C6A917
MITLALALLLLDPSGLEKPTTLRVMASPPAPPVSTAPVLASVAVAVECVANAQGQIETCTVLEETHPGLGFGAAAIALMRTSGAEPSGESRRVVRTIQFTP